MLFIFLWIRKHFDTKYNLYFYSKECQNTYRCLLSCQLYHDSDWSNYSEYYLVRKHMFCSRDELRWNVLKKSSRSLYSVTKMSNNLSHMQNSQQLRPLLKNIKSTELSLLSNNVKKKRNQLQMTAQSSLIWCQVI